MAVATTKASVNAPPTAKKARDDGPGRRLARRATTPRTFAIGRPPIRSTSAKISQWFSTRFAVSIVRIWWAAPQSRATTATAAMISAIEMRGRLMASLPRSNSSPEAILPGSRPAFQATRRPVPLGLQGRASTGCR